jgi:hypothetical protein
MDVREATMEDAAEVLAFVHAKAQFDRETRTRRSGCPKPLCPLSLPIPHGLLGSRLAKPDNGLE